ncbi:hypothetical protein [Labrys neptuniae]|uniref:Uncharacterized protein n=1 Tax=Labrys neptuniae TaxID=376174 RepID=A0ABV3PHN1_9HYPH
MKHQSSPAPAPLFAWPEAIEAARLELARKALVARIKALPVCSHRRIILQHQLTMLTAQLLELETRLKSQL